ncbi:ZBT38 protein, partial [Polypterus senegalus]
MDLGNEKPMQRQLKAAADGNSVTYVAKPACVGASETKGGAPLCQITVRIGEEAIVKRSISETDLMRDKGPPVSKSKKIETVPEDENQHHHHHHHHRFRSTESDGEKEKPKVSKPKEYYLRLEAREEDSDQDAEDNLWRPYYTYKPKRKTLHLQKVKKSSWRRKLRFKRSLRLMRRAERLMDQNLQKSSTDHSTTLSQSINEPGDPEEQDDTVTCSVCDEDFPDYSSLRKHERHHQSGKSFKCITCGRQFSTLKKLDKHELSHLIEFVCMQCQESFHSRELLEEHQKVHQVEPDEQVVDKMKEPGYLDKCNLPRVGRRPSIRHACTYCSKICKTAAALGRHMKRHEIDKEGSADPTAEVSGQATDGDPANVKPEETDREQEKSRPVINCSASNMETCEVSSFESPEKVAASSDLLVSKQLNKSSNKEVTQNKDSENLSPAFSSSETNQLCGSTKTETPVRTEVMDSSPPTVLVMNGRDSLDSCKWETVAPIRVQGNSTELSGGTLQLPSKLLHTKDSMFEFSGDNHIDQVESVPQKHHNNATSTRHPVNEVVNRISMKDEDSIIENEPKQDHLRPGPECDVLSPHLKKDKKYEHAAPSQATTNSPQKSTQVYVQGESLEFKKTVLHIGPDMSQPKPMRHKGNDLPSASQELIGQHLAKLGLPVQEQRTRSHYGRDTPTRDPLLSHTRKEAQEAHGLLLPHKEEKLSPSVADLGKPQTTPSAANVITAHEPTLAQTTLNKCTQKTMKSPSLGPNNPTQELLMSCMGAKGTGIQDMSGLLPSGPAPSLMMSHLAGVNENICKTMLMSQKSEDLQASTPQDLRMHMSYPVQDYPLPLIAPGGCRSSKKQEENLLVSYPSTAIQFGDFGKVSNGELGKLPFYPDPYQLIYGPQLLAYPYNLTALPMALNMVVPNEKGDPLPFLPTFFSYVNPCSSPMQESPLMARASRSSNSREGTHQ